MIIGDNTIIMKEFFRVSEFTEIDVVGNWRDTTGKYGRTLGPNN